MKNISKIIVLATLIGFASSCKEKKSGSDVFASHYKTEKILSEKYLGILYTKGFADDGSGRKDSLAQGISLYKKGKYMESTRLLNAYLDQYESPGNDYEKATFFLGLCEIENDKIGRAIVKFEELKNSSNFEIADKSAYYAGLCYLKINEKKAIGIFEKISKDNESTFQDEAKAILGML